MAPWSVRVVTVVRDDPESLTGGDRPIPEKPGRGPDLGVKGSLWSLWVVRGLVGVEVIVEDVSVTVEVVPAV
jgi:hypothetical protein